MKNLLRHFVLRYFDSRWIPSAVALVTLIIFTLGALVSWKPLTILVNGLLILVGVSILGILAASIWNLIKKRWVQGIINLAMFPVSGIAIMTACGFLMMPLMFGPSEDGFADQLSIPDNIEISEPLDWDIRFPNGAKDNFQTKLLAALQSPGSENPSVTANLPSLAQIHKNTPDILSRYLATSPCWRVFKERGALFATRRWMIGSQWCYSLHGYYTKHIPSCWPNPQLPNFQSRLTLGLWGKPWARISRKSTRIRQGETSRLALSAGNHMHESHCIVLLDGLVVEIFEQSEAKERRLTKAALAYIEKELSPLVSTPEWSTIQTIIPSGSLRRGKPTMELRESLQPGIYNSEIWVNPREPGMIYLQAFEVTHNYRLSTDRLKDRSNEWVGWSDDPSQLFFSNTHFTIYEGDWGKPYAARFEVWFVPDSGHNERKLIEKVFRIEGWQR